MQISITPSKLFARTWVLILLLITSISFMGCAATKIFQPITEPSGSNALVYFIRKKYPPYIHEIRVIVNNNKLATIANNDFAAVNIPIGKNKILVEATDGKPLEFTLPVERAERLYVILTGDVTFAGMEYTGYQHTVRLNWGLKAIPVNRAEAESVVSGFGKTLN